MNTTLKVTLNREKWGLPGYGLFFLSHSRTKILGVIRAPSLKQFKQAPKNLSLDQKQAKCHLKKKMTFSQPLNNTLQFTGIFYVICYWPFLQDVVLIVKHIKSKFKLDYFKHCNAHKKPIKSRITRTKSKICSTWKKIKDQLLFVLCKSECSC